MNRWARYVARLTNGDTQVQVAAKTGIDQGTLSRWLNGKHQPRDAAPVARLAQVYDGNVLEAFVAAGYLTEEEAGMPPRAFDFYDLVDEDEGLSDNAKVHLKNQYGLLRSASAHARAAETIESDPELDDETRKRLLDRLKVDVIYTSTATVVEHPFGAGASAVEPTLAAVASEEALEDPGENIP